MNPKCVVRRTNPETHKNNQSLTALRSPQSRRDWPIPDSSFEPPVKKGLTPANHYATMQQFHDTTIIRMLFNFQSLLSHFFSGCTFRVQMGLCGNSGIDFFYDPSTVGSQTYFEYLWFWYAINLLYLK